ncbi:MAG: flagellar hook-associated protein FlgL [Nitrospinae bacterium]|nr:flagellar hook-associated protein FlgL [Nitrospinota bacterium]
MRIANNSIFHAVVRNLMRNQERFLKLEEAIASGRRVDRLSTDPPAVIRILGLRTTIASLEQFQRTIERATSWLSLSEVSLTQVEDVLMRAKELAVAQASGTANAETRAAAAKEVDILRQQVIQAGNAQFGTQFLFAGRKTNVAPFLSDGTYQGDSGSIDVEIGQGHWVTLNIPGDVAFTGVRGGVDILNALQAFKKALETDDQPGIQAQLDLLDRSLNQVVRARAEVGANMGRLATEKEKLLEVSGHLTQMLGETEGADLAKTISDLTQQQSIYQASLAASARAIQPTLLDFLR